MEAQTIGVRDQELLLRLADHGNDVVWALSADCELTYVSPSVVGLRGFTPEEVMRQTLDDLFAPDSAAIAAANLRELLTAVEEGRRPPVSFCDELEYTCADGSTIWTEVLVLPRYGPDGALLEILGVTRDVSVQRAQRAALREAQLEAERQRVLADERLRIARELHDDLLQSLTAVGLDIAAAEVRSEAPSARDALRRAQDDLALASESARRLVVGLRARPLVAYGLRGAVRHLADEFAERNALPVTTELGDVGDVDAAVEDALFGVVQESLANVHKHARAASVVIGLGSVRGAVQLTVVDDGCGIDLGRDAGGGFGLVGMRERMAMVDGTLEVAPEPYGGTRVTARVPV